MNEILEQMKKRIEPLLALTYKANKLVCQAQQNGYEVNLECWSTTGVRPTTNGIQLTRFRKDFSAAAGDDVSPKALKNCLEQITRELLRLENEDYCIEVSGRRPNGHDSLFVENVCMILTSRDYDQRYAESTKT